MPRIDTDLLFGHLGLLYAKCYSYAIGKEALLLYGLCRTRRWQVTIQFFSPNSPAMESFFIDPASLPGGRQWIAACNVLVASGTNSSHLSPSVQETHEALHCGTSPTSGFVQVILLLIVYGFILFKASQLIAHGSELLLLVPSLRGIVGSVVLPILGAVPDGAIVLFSGLGPNAQEELAVGVGALAGSTTMLLTLPWFLSVLSGRVNIRADGHLTYHHRLHKLIPPNNFSLGRTGVQPLPMVRTSGLIMIATAISYVVIQGAAIWSGTFFKANQTKDAIQAAARMEHWPALVCFLVASFFFVWYLVYQVTNSSMEEKDYFEAYVDEVKQNAIRHGEVSLTAAFQEIWIAASEADESTGLTIEDHKKDRLRSLLRTFFNNYDYDGNHSIDRLELANLMRDLGEFVTAEDLSKMYEAVDANRDGRVELDEFVEYMPKFIISQARSHRGSNWNEFVADQPEQPDEEGGDQESSDEEDEEVPEDLRHADPKKQIRRVTIRAFTQMAWGTALVLIFSDPMVAVLNDFGARIGVSAFYVSFFLAPLASNASELLAAQSYAAKKTKKTITISFTTLLGAAIMNNTFVLAIFMLLLTLKGLAWTFTAETISILFIEIFMTYISQKRVITLRDGFYVLLMYPVTVLLVAFLEGFVGLD